LLNKAERINTHVKNDTLPDYVDDTSGCPECPFWGICTPSTQAKEYDFINDAEIIAKVERLHELKESSKEYSDLDSELKEIFHQKENVIIGNKYCYQGKYITVNRKAQSAKEAETSKQWRGKFSRIE